MGGGITSIVLWLRKVDMQPTMKLRWFERKHKNLPPEFNRFSQNVTEVVLQQWWAVFREGQETPQGEWVDINLQKE